MIMASLEAHRVLELAILDYLSKRGFHQTSEAFSNEIRTNQNLVAINSPHEAFLQEWWDKFYEAYNSRFPDFPVFDVRSIDKVAQTVKNVVGDNRPANQSYASDLTGANISTVMPESSSPDLLLDLRLSDLLSSFDASDVSLDLSPQRDMTSGLHLPEMSEMGDMLPLASNAGYQMQQMPTVPAEWNARVDIPGANLGGPMRMEQNLHAATNALPDLPELSDAGNYRSLQQASHQGLPSVGISSIFPSISHQVVRPSVLAPTQKEQFPRTTSFPRQNVLPNAAVQTWDKLILPAPASSSDFLRMLTLADSSVKDAGMLGETNKRIPENLPADQLIIAPVGGIMRSSGKQPAVQDQINQLGLQSSNKGISSIFPGISHQVVRPSVLAPTQKEQFPRTTSFPRQNVLPNAAVQTWDKLILPAPASSSDFLRMLTLADSSVKDAGMLGETNKRIPENLPADQLIIAPVGGIMRSSGKQPAVQDQINQLGLQSSNKRGIKRKTPLCSLTPVGKEKATIAGFAAFAQTQAEREEKSFKAISHLHTKSSKLLCCHFNSNGELLATAGHDKKVLIWELGTNNVNSGEGHAHHVTDIRFRPNSTVFATSSFDRTVKLWDAAKPSNPLQNLDGHVEQVMSLDFHPTKLGLLSSCDTNDDIRFWDVSRGNCELIFKGGSRHVRFQPLLGDLLASSTGNIINIFDVETSSIQKKLQGHVKDIRSICWHMNGDYLASVSEDSARIWSVSDGKCLHELCSGGNKFQSCTFHPGHILMLVIGSCEFLELWNPMCQRSITQSYSAHAGIISSLADSPAKGTIASASHDQWIKIWR